jgi:hypothetical protein
MLLGLSLWLKKFKGFLNKQPTHPFTHIIHILLGLFHKSKKKCLGSKPDKTAMDTPLFFPQRHPEI